jgi:hypothetical protein
VKSVKPFIRLDPKALAQHFADADSPGFAALPGMIPAELAQLLCRELEDAFIQGRLALAPAGVGEEAKVSTVRADCMGFFTGAEAALQQASPACADLIDWCIAHLPALLAPAHAGKTLMIRRAMLARYPAPSNGYHAHVDNLAGLADNGRALTLLCYLNPPPQPCNGGELAIWGHGNDAANPPSAILEAEGGSGVLFASRDVLHMVCPLDAGPPRWAISFWLHDDRPPAADGAPCWERIGQCCTRNYAATGNAAILMRTATANQPHGWRPARQRMACIAGRAGMVDMAATAGILQMGKCYWPGRSFCIGICTGAIACAKNIKIGSTGPMQATRCSHRWRPNAPSWTDWRRPTSRNSLSASWTMPIAS